MISVVVVDNFFIYEEEREKIIIRINKAESNQWLMDTALSAAVLIGFIIAIILSKST